MAPAPRRRRIAGILVLNSLALMLLAAAQPPEPTTLPRQQDATPYEQRHAAQERPTDPLFDSKRTAPDDASFIVSAVENVRQASLDARSAERGLTNGPLRETAAAIGKLNEATTRNLETLAKRKGWRLPAQNPGRATTLPAANPHRAGANFILHQISFHQTTLEQFRTQIAGKGDPELKRTLRAAVPGYEKNLVRLLESKVP